MQSPDEALGFFDSVVGIWAFEFCRITTGRVAKLARLVYRMLRYRMKYVDRGAAFYESEHQRFQIKHLKWKAAKLGYKVTLLPQPNKRQFLARLAIPLCETSNHIS